MLQRTVLGDERLSVISLYRTCQDHRWTFATSPSIGSVQKCILQWAVRWEGGKHRHVTVGQWLWTSFPALTSCVTVNRFASVFSFVKRKRWYLPQMDVSGNSWDHGERTERTSVIPGCWQMHGMLFLQREVPVERLRERLPRVVAPVLWHWPAVVTWACSPRELRAGQWSDLDTGLSWPQTHFISFSRPTFLSEGLTLDPPAAQGGPSFLTPYTSQGTSGGQQGAYVCWASVLPLPGGGSSLIAHSFLSWLNWFVASELNSDPNPDPSVNCVSCPPGSSVRGILQAEILQWVAISSSRASSWPVRGPLSPGFLF